MTNQFVLISEILKNCGEEFQPILDITNPATKSDVTFHSKEKELKALVLGIMYEFHSFKINFELILKLFEFFPFMVMLNQLYN